MKKIYIPSNLDLPSLGIDDTDEIDKYHYFVHLIYEQRVLYKINQEFVPLKALYLRKIINQRFEECRKKLLEFEIIECDKHYIKGKKCYGYKLEKYYADVKHKQVELNNQNIIKNIENWKSKRLPTTDVHLYLYKFLEKVEIDYDEALNFVDSMDSVTEYNSAKIAIDKFKNKDFFLYSDDFGNRVHTNITNLKSILRKYLSYNGNKLVNIDIVNSQPLFLLLTPPIYTIRCARIQDVDTYRTWVEQGVLYDRLMEKAGISNRKFFKEDFFKNTFFGRRTSKTFWELFPSIAQILANIKNDDYRKIAWMMQRAESKLMIDTICHRIMKQYGERVFIATIHDSILTTEEHVSKIERIITEEFANVELTPTIRIERYI